MNDDALFELAGWIGMVVILVTYYFVTIGKWGPRTRIDEIMNVIGSTLIGVNVYHFGAWPAFALNVAWGIIAIVHLAQKTRTRRG